MKYCVMLSMLLALGCVHVHAAPVEVAMQQGSCTDPIALGAADQALTKINRDRQEGYIFSLERLSNVHMTKHGENSLVFYLTLDVVETNCSVVSKKGWKECEVRPEPHGSVYGQCKVAILMNRVQRVVHLHKYDCVIRPVPSGRLHRICPDCPSRISTDSDIVAETVSKSLEKFNKESGLTKRFALVKISRATAGMAVAMYYHADYIIQETTCARTTETPDNCPLMECEFAHKGFCHGSMWLGPPGAPEHVTVNCELYEPEAAEREKKLHSQGNVTDHSHGDTEAHNHDHDHAHSADQTHTHDHAHDHTQSHSHHDKSHKHADDSAHHHTHDHEGGAHKHAHDHSHDHGHDHDHVHAHHAKAHDHSGDSPNQHHAYNHADGVHTHEHDHEFSLDHDHKHTHLHEHEHHHHHHDHGHETTAHDHPTGSVRVLPAVDQPMTMPSFPDQPVGPAAEDSMTVGEDHISFLPFPTSASAECPPPALEEKQSLVKQLFAEDPLFKPAA